MLGVFRWVRNRGTTHADLLRVAVVTYRLNTTAQSLGSKPEKPVRESEC